MSASARSAHYFRKAPGQLQPAVDPGLAVGPVAGDHKLAVGPQLRRTLEVLHIGDQAIEVGEMIVVEMDQRASGADVEPGDACLAAVELDLDDLEQVRSRFRQASEPVD